MQRRCSIFLLCGLLICANQANASVMLGAFVPGNGWKLENIYSLNDQLHKKLSFITLFSAFTEGWDQLYWQSGKVVSAGMVPMISWMPIDQNRKEVNILPEITNGLWDGYIIEWSDRFVAWRNSFDEGSRPNILLRFGHEFNGNWYSYSGAPEVYKEAWRHVYQLFERRGVNDYIEWVWCANNLNIDTVNDVTRYYPGDTFVDWTSIDGYNWGSNFGWTTWESFTDVYADLYNTLVTNYPDKPILIAEYGSTEPSDVPDPSWGQNGDDSDRYENKDAWLYDMLVALEQSFPAIRAISLFNINKELGWSISGAKNTGMTGMNRGLSSDYFVSEYITAPDRNTSGEPQDGKEPSEPSMAFAHDREFYGPEQQKRLALSRDLPAVKRGKVEQMRQGFLSLEGVGRAQLREMKHSVLGSE